MSLELIAKTSSCVKEESQIKIIKEIEKLEYDIAYQSPCKYGFVYKGQSYTISNPPLFILEFKNESVVLSVFGDLNEQKKIEAQVLVIFKQNGINIVFEEE